MGQPAPETVIDRATDRGPRSLARALVRPAETSPTWLLVVVAGLAVLSVVEEFVSGPEFTGFAASMAFVGMHLSWPLVLRWPAAGAVVALISAVFAAITLERVGVATMTVMITLVATCALAQKTVALVTLVASLAWAAWTTAYFSETQAFFWGLALVFLLSGAVGAFIRIVVLDLLRTRRRVRQMEEHAEKVRHEERLAIARELHDVVAHELTLMSLQSASCRRTEDPEVMRRTLTQINENSRAALTELRALLGVLRWEGDAPPRPNASPTAGADLPQTLERLLARVRDAGFDVVSTVQIQGWRGLSSSCREATVRIAQEALANVTKHAPAGTQCSFTVRIDRDRVLIHVSSVLPRPNSRPQDPALSSRQGLIGIRERAQVLGGSATAGASDGAWVVDAVVPRQPIDRALASIEEG